MKPYTKNELTLDMPVMHNAQTMVMKGLDKESGWLALSDGVCRKSTSIDYAKCYPIDMVSLWAASAVQYRKNELYKHVRSLNWPDVNRKLMCFFQDLCEAEDKETREAVYNQMDTWCTKVAESVSDAKNVVIDGVSIFAK